MKREYQICIRCVMDTSDPEIQFDSYGVCNHCKQAEVLLHTEPFCLTSSEKESALKEFVSDIKNAGKNKRYDCIIGLSGGVDSTYVAYKVKELGLRPLAIHLDNGWDSELSVINIENICKKLNIELFTWVLDWEEFKDLQLSFLKASTPDSEIPSDNAINAVMWRMAKKYGVKYILAGTNISSESILPRTWSQGHYDLKYITGLQKIYGTRKLKTFPMISAFDLALNQKISGIQYMSFLDYLDYDKNIAKDFIINELGWRDYGRKHCESNYTRIYQEYILPTKFGFDKRKAHLSSLIMAGQITRNEALEQLKEPLYTDTAKIYEDIAYLANKLEISEADFNNIMQQPIKSYDDYPNMQNTWYLSLIISIYRRLKRYVTK